MHVLQKGTLSRFKATLIYVASTNPVKPTSEYTLFTIKLVLCNVHCDILLQGLFLHNIPYKICEVISIPCVSIITYGLDAWLNV